MTIPFIILCLQTIALWLLAVFLHRKKSSITLIPLYSYITILTIFTHNFSDLGFVVSVDGWVFLVASFSFFTTLMFSTLFVYLFEGPRAGRFALWVITLSSLFYIVVVFLTGLMVDTSSWIILDAVRASYYFWSLLAIIVDIVFLAIAWELLSSLKSMALMVRVFLVTFGVLILDTLIFTTGVFGSEDFYLSMLEGNIMIRLALSVLSAPITAYFLKREGFTEEGREKPKNFWEILNFRSDLESKIIFLEEMLKKQQAESVKNVCAVAGTSPQTKNLPEGEVVIKL